MGRRNPSRVGKQRREAATERKTELIRFFSLSIDFKYERYKINSTRRVLEETNRDSFVLRDELLLKQDASAGEEQPKLVLLSKAGVTGRAHSVLHRNRI